MAGCDVWLSWWWVMEEEKWMVMVSAVEGEVVCQTIQVWLVGAVEQDNILNHRSSPFACCIEGMNPRFQLLCDIYFWLEESFLVCHGITIGCIAVCHCHQIWSHGPMESKLVYSFRWGSWALLGWSPLWSQLSLVVGGLTQSLGWSCWICHSQSQQIFWIVAQ